MDAETLESVGTAIEAAGSLRSAAKRLGVSAGTLSDISNGRTTHVSLDTENKVRVALNLQPLALRKTRPFTRWADAPPSVLAAAIRNRTEM